MSRARLVITAVVVEGSSQAEVARRYGVSPGWVSRLLARYRTEGEAAFEPRSRRPHSSPGAIPATTVEAIIGLRKELVEQGLDAGPHTIAWHLKQHHGLVVSTATISRHLSAAGLVTPQPKKRPEASYVRFEAELPNETWQSDFTHYRLTNPDGTPGPDVEIISWLDDHSRYALHISAHPRITGPTVLATFRQTLTCHGIPASTLTDNGMVYTARLTSQPVRGGRTSLETELRRLHITQKNSRPNHPQTSDTTGRVERFQQTLKKWLRAQPVQPATIAELQALIDRFIDAYNHRRPHKSLPHRATPAAVYNTKPKALPSTSRDTDTHDRIRHDRVDTNGKLTLRHAGRLHHIGIGRTHARTPIIMLIHDLDIRIVNAITGELIRELVLDPTRNYQPTGKTRYPTRHQRTEPQC